MTRWEFCQLRNPDRGTDGVYFSHRQHDGFVEAASARLGRGLKAERSDGSFLHLNLNNYSAVGVAGFLGEQGWELVSHAVLTGGHEYWTFRRTLASE